ncbi:aldose epimerase family protein [Vagococcus fluvialis]|uniref:aldose epimerase family protein n=1 Tax=Vagococcus fluvialis TaxID=2738 RepID=UPI001A8D1042|nr:aldose epimerase family protein [Vagococcus fluvialis]MBO0488173.1 galactose mutarotase [Vagococcus fluvialis]
MLKTTFGQSKNGETISLYSFENAKQMKMVLTDFGAVLTQLWVPDKEGNLNDVVLGFDTLAEYEVNPTYFGATIGRSCNRIKNGTFKINDISYQLKKNEGENSLHSGPEGYHLRIWKVIKTTDNSITFKLDSPNGDQGYPGQLTLEVTYQLTETGIKITYTGHTDQTTIFNPTNHTYFNLNGHSSGTILEHELELKAQKFTPVIDSSSVPTGEIIAVKDTPMDFTTAKKVGVDIDSDYDQLNFTAGYDHNYILDKNVDYFVKMVGDKTNIVMKAATNLAGVQFYTGNFIDNLPGKENKLYQKHEGLCLETQFYPNSINETNFVSPILEKDEIRIYWTTYDFSIE